VVTIGAFVIFGWRVMGLSQERHCQHYHRGLNWAQWSRRAVVHVLLEMGVCTFAPMGAVVIGSDDTPARRRRGQKLGAGAQRSRKSPQPASSFA
jgi:hypothetical protein